MEIDDCVWRFWVLRAWTTSFALFIADGVELVSSWDCLGMELAGHSREALNLMARRIGSYGRLSHMLRELLASRSASDEI